MSEPFIGQVTMFAGNFAPRGWAFCDGQLLPISQNTALFSLLGTIYGGDGRTTFALPDLRGRMPVHAGEAAKQPKVTQGQRFGGAKATAADGEGETTRPYIAARYVIALQGEYPSRTGERARG